MKNLKKIVFIAAWSFLIIGLLLTMGFVNKQQETMLCKNLEVKINPEDDVFFLNAMDVKRLINERGDSIAGQPKYSVNIPEIENALNSNSDIAKAEVFITVDGVVKVKVKQREPIIRIFNNKYDSYYLDDEGKIMPLSNKYTARVIVANGNIVETPSNYKFSIAEIAKDSLKKANSVLDELYAIANYVKTNKFWNGQIQQIYVNNEREIELVPLVGDQKIIFGDTSSMEEKFTKLFTFYTQGLNTTGWWTKYSIINLKFKNQIVCTKK